MDRIRNLLHQVAIISQKNAEILDATGGRFNMFSVCGVNHYENTHSAIIAELLDPNGSHGLKEKLLEAFVETLGERFAIPDFECKGATVRTECSTPSDGRIDIIVTDNRGNAIIIENKIYANDQWEQLKRYDTFAKSKFKRHQLLYLTLNGCEASEHSKIDHYERISYCDTIIDWLERCVTIAARHPGVREIVIQYINHLKQLTNQDMSTKQQEELVDLIVNNPRMMQSADDIQQIWRKCTERMTGRLRDTLVRIGSDLGLEVETHDNFGNKKDTGVWLFRPEWDFSIIFYFFKNDSNTITLWWGLDARKDQPSESCSTSTRERLVHLFPEKRGDMAISGEPFALWNNSNWADWAGREGEEKLHVIIFEKTKDMLNAIEHNLKNKI